MLEELRVENFAVIEKMAVTFDNGLNVISGETGTGKSIMIQALSGLIGERLDQSTIRSGQQKATVEGVFKTNNEILLNLEDFGLTTENPIIVRRVIGSGRAGYINDSRVAIHTLKWLGSQLVELLGQHEQQSLFKLENHLNFLDSFLRNDDKLDDLASLYQSYINKKKDYHDYKDRMGKLKEKKELISYQLEEIKSADLKAGEEEILNQELNLLKTAERREEYISEILHYFYNGENSAYELLSKIEKLLAKLIVVDPKVKEDHEEMKQLLLRSEELGRDVQSYKENIEYSSERIDEVIARLETIKRLKKKYGNHNAVEDLRGSLSEELNAIKDYPFDLQKKKEKLDLAEEKLYEFSRRISKERKAGAKKLQKLIEKSLKELNINSHFMIEFSEIPVSPKGIDKVEFHITVNPGEDPKPIRKVASGGELSRIILVMKSILADLDKIPILIFDEIDTGIGGRVGELIGLRLSELAHHHQVICITHLPQIAKFADRHFYVEKYVRKGRTYTRLRQMDGKERIIELARMIGGKKVSELSKRKAKEMLEEAKCLRSQT